MNNFIDKVFDFSFLEEGFIARDILEQKINEASLSDDKDAFYVADLGDIVVKHIRWLKALPRVTPFYAVKCNDSTAVVKTIAFLGVGFDCASKAEIQLVQSIGVKSEKIIYANPCKQISQIKYAASCGVEMMTFDSEGELMKVVKNHPNAKLVLRIATDDSRAVIQLSMKFGAPLKTSRLLLERAKELNVDIIGVSFHVGSGCKDPQTFVQAVSDARYVFNMGAELGFNMHLLDIGGGFPGSENAWVKFEEATSVINLALDKHFPANSGVQIIAEPGRYYVASAFTLAVNITTKKVMLPEQMGSDDENHASKKILMYYVNDGIHGSFSLISRYKFDMGVRKKKRSKSDKRLYSSSIWGPTCDGLDRIVEQCDLPELQVGDWILFENMGAYTVSASSTFNGFQRPTLYYVMSRAHWQLIHTIREHGIVPELPELNGIVPELPELNGVHVSCAWKNQMELISIACTL